MITLKKCKEYFVNYRKNNKEKIRLASKKYRQNHPDRVKKTIYAWREKNPGKVSEYNKKYNKNRINNPNFDKEYHKKRWRKIRLECLTYYCKGTPYCMCCGEKEINFLSFDHINGGGTKHRKEVKYANISDWIKQNNFPDIFQVLCHNCNMAKGFYGECPHKYSPAVLKPV